MIFVCRSHRATRWSVLPLLLLSLSAVVCGAVPVAADGANTRGLVLRVSVNTRPGLGAVRPGIRVGDPVVMTYRLVNRGGADLHDVRVSDPRLPGVRLRCAGGKDRVPMLRALTSTTCTATTVSRPGTWTGEVRAVGRIPSLRAKVTATARSGWAGVGGGLGLSETVRVDGRTATIRYRVTNGGNRTVFAIRLTDRLLGDRRLGGGLGIDCGGGHPVVPRLIAGGAAVCRAVVRRGPGTYVSQGAAEGSDRVRTLDRSGDLVPPPTLTARASAPFVLTAPPAPPQPTPPVQAPRTPPPPQGPPPAAEPAVPVVPAVPAVPAVPGTPLVPLVPFVPPVPAGALFPFPPPPPPAIAAPGIAPAAEPGGAAVAPPPPPAAQRTTGQPPQQAQPRQQAPKRSLLSRLRRPGGGPTGLGLLVILFLLLIPGVVAAVLLGSRRQ
ncbi:hypothetical protein PV682_31905 [Streptomyces niveiscabiei]|uniref:hypothetical protein n=1 Tax=Streptomyces niveiscabiei TaxID=164115 RepID=UPI0029BD6675|nr:hypothetical protein [Streptomyces niveiscabiei]MDX3386028.1 hypothetical protein [Streptomyces niveiscabiei]